MAKPAISETPDDKADSPLSRLNELLKADIERVNAEILQRLESDIPLIPQLARYLIAAGGKRIRPLLTLAASRLCCATENQMERAVKLAAAVEFIHTATLLHDDVVDESTERRGQTSANLVFGNSSTVLVGDFLFARAFELMVETESLHVLKILSGASATITEGEILQLTYAGSLETNITVYDRIIGAKTAALFAAATEAPTVINGRNETESAHLREYGQALGMAFQMADDAHDYVAEAAAIGKTIGDDFREGKVTLPVIYAMEQADAAERSFWKRCLEDRNQNEEDLAQAQIYIRNHGAIEKSLGRAHEAALRAQKALASLHNADPDISQLLADLALYAASRPY